MRLRPKDHPVGLSGTQKRPEKAGGSFSRSSRFLRETYPPFINHCPGFAGKSTAIKSRYLLPGESCGLYVYDSLTFREESFFCLGRRAVRRKRRRCPEAAIPMSPHRLRGRRLRVSAIPARSGTYPSLIPAAEFDPSRSPSSRPGRSCRAVNGRPVIRGFVSREKCAGCAAAAFYRRLPVDSPARGRYNGRDIMNHPGGLLCARLFRLTLRPSPRGSGS